LEHLGTEVILLTPGPADTSVRNITADMSLIEQELAGRGYGYVELLKKHPLTFVSLARQVQAEIIAKAFAMANNDELDVVHIYTNEEDIALPFIQFCKKTGSVDPSRPVPAPHQVQKHVSQVQASQLDLDVLRPTGRDAGGHQLDCQHLPWH
jgi:hypothetical protein